MRTLPVKMLHLLNPFVPLFSQGVCGLTSRYCWPERSSPRAKELLVPHCV